MIHTFVVQAFHGVTLSLDAIGKNHAIIGGNGSGKTHILEGIHMLSGGSLQYFQGKKPSTFELYGTIQHNEGEKTYSILRREDKEKFFIQGSAISGKRYRESFPFRSVFISPFDMNLLYFAPSLRREYVDSILDRAFGQFRGVKKDYEEALRQRNALLKSIRNGEVEKKSLDYWDRVFSEKAYIYSLYRRKWYAFVRKNSDLLSQFFEKYSLIPCFRDSTENMDAESIAIHLIECRERDIVSGHTHIGPHIDDLGFHIIAGSETYEASLYLSRGENKLLLLALKQIEVLFLKETLGLPILLLFDDLFAELDMKNALIIIEKFNAEQIIISSQRDLPKEEKWKDFSCNNLTHE